ncbi:hypothetical protein SAMN05216198_2990 [Halopseudomonas litoralis]|uniref:Uncharacterized protein n=1 Tax=Halopseudomonas litoralis TaxID=797277 RepID=A0A1H1VNJ7_9GAMM|nr:hypothetical protein SAMN05216198_2990 [Halopseudomonas litoralis]
MRRVGILTGHTNHDILFIATQVARAAGLKNPSNRASLNAQYDPEQAIRVNRLPDWQSLPLNGRPDLQARSWIFTRGDLHEVYNKSIDLPNDMSGKTYQSKTALLDQSRNFVIERGGANPGTWVTEVVLPSIRKTGSFNVTEAQDDTSRQYAG